MWFSFRARAGVPLLLAAGMFLTGAAACNLAKPSGDDDEKSSDDDDKKKKKKKKKKKDGETDGDPKPSSGPSPTPAPPTPTPQPAGGGACDKVISGLSCVRDKLPPSAQASMQQQIDNLRKMGAMAETACPQMLEGMKDLFKQYNCVPGGSDQPSPQPPTPLPGPTPTPTPTPSPSTPRSNPPETAEWGSVTKEVMVNGSSALNCETKMLREWVRYSCRGKNFSGGTVTGVKVTKGGNGSDDFILNGAGIASLVVRFVEGVDLEAEFTWTDRTHTLLVQWPRGAPEPPSKGKFNPPPK
jgi:hypothetical protein